MYVGRTAPSASGPPHVGTLYSAWLVRERARQKGGIAWARIDDLDAARVHPHVCDDIERALVALGYDSNVTIRQSRRRAGYEAALDRLASMGRLYACVCAKARIRNDGRALANGGYAYDNHCRSRLVTPVTWRRCTAKLRVALPDDEVAVVVENQRQTIRPAVGGDPVVVRQDGVMAYAIASVVDDIALGVTEIVRGRDLADMMAPQVGLFRLLGAPVPSFVHHRLFLGADHKKLSKSAGDGDRWRRERMQSVLQRFAEGGVDASLEGADEVWEESWRCPPLWTGAPHLPTHARDDLSL